MHVTVPTTYCAFSEFEPNAMWWQQAAGIRQKEHVDDAMMAKAAGIRGDIQYVTPDASL